MIWIMPDREKVGSRLLAGDDSSEQLETVLQGLTSKYTYTGASSISSCGTMEQWEARLYHSGEMIVVSDADDTTHFRLMNGASHLAL